MRELKAFFYIFYKSLTSINYYKDVVESNIKLTVKYFILLGVLGAILSSVTITFRLAPEIKGIFTDSLEQLQKQYPDDLVITFNEQGWSINKEEPLIISFPEEYLIGVQSQNNNGTANIFPKNIVVFKHDGTISDLQNLDTFILMNARNVLVKQGGGFQTFPLRDIPESEVTKTDLIEFISGLKILFSVLPFIMGMLIFLFLAAANVFLGTLYIFAVTGILWLLSNFLQKKFLFSNLFKISVHAMTFVIIMQFIVGVLNLQIPNILYFITNLALAGIAVIYLNKQNAPDQS